MIDDPDYSKSTIRLLVFQALKQWDTEALFSLLFDEDYIIRSAVARELQTRGEEKIFRKLKKNVKDPRSYVREICAFTMGQLGTPDMPYKKESVPLLRNMLTDNNAEVRAAAACAFGHLCSDDMSQEIESQLILMADDKNEEVRKCAAFALGSSSGSKHVIAALYRLQNDHCKEVQSWAETGLEILNDKKVNIKNNQ
jgi:HEAT repeat protein